MWTLLITIYLARGWWVWYRGLSRIDQYWYRVTPLGALFMLTLCLLTGPVVDILYRIGVMPETEEEWKEWERS